MVRLFRRSTGQLLAEASVSASNGWNRAPIDPPVRVDPWESYTVAVYLAGSGGVRSVGLSFPDTYGGQIVIEGGTVASTESNPNAIPTNVVTTLMYGQPDITFVTLP